MSHPLVTVSIPVYKSEKYIVRCLDSVKAQTYSNIEIDLINDCTPDGSIQLIDEYIKTNPQLKIRLIHLEKNQGLSVVRNTGIDNANGDYLYFLDSDDEITPNCIELLVNKALETNATTTIAQNRWINTFDNTTKDFGFATNATKDLYTGNCEIFKDYSESKFPITSWNKLFKVDFIRQHKIYFMPGLYGQDELWFFELMLKMDSLAIIPDITYLYYLHSDSVIFNRTKKNFENYNTILERINELYKENPDKKTAIKKFVINFKGNIQMMQWKAMRSDEDYWKFNYSRMKKYPHLSLFDYFSSEFDTETKKKNFWQNLPTGFGFRMFKKRYGA